jgi:hypothetical protein
MPESPPARRALFFADALPGLPDFCDERKSASDKSRAAPSEAEARATGLLK